MRPDLDSRLIAVNSPEDVLPVYRNTPIAKVLEYHNLKQPFDQYSKAEVLVAMCMDNRKHINLPDNFAFVIRTGGANLRYSEFKVSFSIAIGGIRAIALVAHTNCGMVNLISNKEKFVKGLVEASGWDEQSAEDHFFHFAPMFEIGSELDFVLSETKRLRLRYPKILIAPMLYKVEDNKLYLINE